MPSYYQRPKTGKITNTTIWASKIALYIFAFILVIWVEAGFKFHFSETIRFLFFTGDYLTLAGILIVGLLLGKVLEFLLLLSFHNFFRRKGY